MQNTFDALEPLPRICPVDIPVLFSGTTSSSNTASATAGGPVVPENKDENGDEQDAVFTELDACMRVLEDIKPKVGADREGNSSCRCNGLESPFLSEGGGG